MMKTVMNVKLITTYLEMNAMMTVQVDIIIIKRKEHAHFVMLNVRNVQGQQRQNVLLVIFLQVKF